MATPRRVLARRAARLLGYWRSETRTFRQGLVALTISTAAGFIAGLTLAGSDQLLRDLPGLLVLIPASVGLRGSIFGAMGARLGTQIAAGLFVPNLRPGGPLRTNVEVTVVSALAASFFLAVIAKLVAAAFGESTISLWDLVTISVLSGAIASAVIIVLTVGLAITSFRRGWDLDAVATPLLTALGDMITLPAIVVAALITRTDAANAALATVCTVASAAAVLYAVTHASPITRRILREMAPIVAVTPIIDVFAGAVLEAQRDRLLTAAAVLIMIPPFVSQAGALGGILSSRLSSKLRLGVISPRGRPQPPALVDGSVVVALALVVFAFIGLAAWFIAEATGQIGPGIGSMLGASLLAGALVVPLMLVTAYYVAVATSRHGLDPDNAGVPIITSVMDLAGVSAVIFIMGVSGVI